MKHAAESYPRRPGRIARLAALALVLPLAAEENPWEHLRPSRQVGPSCAFFANVPAVTLATGIDVGSSKPFVRSVYGLYRGDFQFHSAFDKRVFFELFALPYDETEIVHPAGPARPLMPAVRELVTGTLDPGLVGGRVYPLRIRGRTGRPHNGLLIGRHRDRYVLHNPNPGTIWALHLDQLAEMMLVRSRADEHRGREVYVTHFLTVTLPSRAEGRALLLGELPKSLRAVLSVGQRERLAAILAAGRAPRKGTKLAGYLAAYPELDFAVLESGDSLARPRNVIRDGLTAHQLAGVLRLSKLTLNAWHLKRRPLLPVVFMEGRPWVLVRYQPADSGRPTLAFDDGEATEWLSEHEALRRIRADGAIYATVELAWE